MFLVVGRTRQHFEGNPHSLVLIYPPLLIESPAQRRARQRALFPDPDSARQQLMEHQ